MNPDQPSQPFNPNSDDNATPQPSRPLPSSAPEWQQEAVNNVAAGAPVPSEAPATPTQPASPVVGQPPVTPVVSGDAMQSPVAPGVTPDAMPPQMPGMPMASSQTSGGSMLKRIIIVAVGLVVLVGLGFLGYKGLQSAQNTKNKNATNNAAKQGQKSTTAPDINTLASFSLIQPSASALGDFTATPSTDESAPTTLANTAQSCVILYGKLNQTALPGTNIGSIVAAATQTIKSQGISIAGPNTEQPLVLKNTTTSATYSMPTVGFSYTKSGVAEVAVYSISQLKDGTHAAVLQVCYGKDTVANLTTKINTVTKPVAEAIGVQTP